LKTDAKIINTKNAGRRASALRLLSCAAALCLLLQAACVDLVERTASIGNYTIAFDPQGGLMDSVAMSAAYGSAVILPDAFLDGYSLAGWYPEDIYSSNRYGVPGGGYTVYGDVTMYARWSKNLEPGDSTINGIPVILVEVASFIMGSPESEEGRYFDETQRRVTLTKSYWMSKYPVTNFQYGKAVPAGEENWPVTRVIWEEARAFAESKGGRLPTEAEWEFAARGGVKSQGYLYSGSDTVDDVAWYINNFWNGDTSPFAYSGQSVGQKQPNELGIHDMSGNVFEWCSDWYGFHTGDPVTDPTGPETGLQGRITRGGAWTQPARDARVADRAHSDPGIADYNQGFRILFPME